MLNKNSVFCMGRLTSALVSIVLAMSLASCGGGGDSVGAPSGGSSGGSTPVVVTPVPDPGTPTTPAVPTTPVTPVTPVTPTPPVQAALHPTLSGKLYFNGPGTFVEMDLKTGVERVLRARDGWFWTSRDATDFVTTNRFVEDADFGNTDEELVFFDRDGLQKTRFLKSDGFGDRPEISPTGEHVLVEWSSTDQGDPCCIRIPSIFLRSGGTPVKRYSGYGEYNWMSNGKIVMVKGDSIYIVSSTGTGNLTQFGEPVLLKSFPNNKPFAIVSSPDSSRVAFALAGASSSENHVWIMNIDGSGLKQLTTSNTNEEPSDFSPDGTQVVISQGISFASIGPGFVFAGCPEAYVIPISVMAPLSVGDNIPAPGIKLRSFFSDGSLSSKACIFSRAQWRNPPDVVPNLGTSITGAGINRGLTGKMLYTFAGDFFVTDLFNATKAKPGNRTTDDLSASRDGTELIFSDRFAAGTGVGRAKVSIINPAGVEISSFFTVDGFGGALKFSPDKTRFAANWSSTDIGDPVASIITLFTRTGTRLNRYKDFSGYDWATDNLLYLSSFNELYRVDPTTSAQPTLITRTANSLRDIQISPDGTKVAFIMKSSAWIMNVDGTALRKLTESNVLLGEVAWSPNGKVIAVSERDSPYKTWAVPADGTRVPLNSIVVNTTAFKISEGPNNFVGASSKISWR